MLTSIGTAPSGVSLYLTVELIASETDSSRSNNFNPLDLFSWIEQKRITLFKLSMPHAAFLRAISATQISGGLLWTGLQKLSWKFIVLIIKPHVQCVVLVIKRIMAHAGISRGTCKCFVLLINLIIKPPCSVLFWWLNLSWHLLELLVARANVLFC